MSTAISESRTLSGSFSTQGELQASRVTNFAAHQFALHSILQLDDGQTREVREGLELSSCCIHKLACYEDRGPAMELAILRVGRGGRMTQGSWLRCPRR